MLVPARLGLRRTVRTHYRPHFSLTSGRPCSALSLTACPATPKPRPGAPHSRPEVRASRALTARYDRRQTAGTARARQGLHSAPPMSPRLPADCRLPEQCGIRRPSSETNRKNPVRLAGPAQERRTGSRQTARFRHRASLPASDRPGRRSPLHPQCFAMEVPGNFGFPASGKDGVQPANATSFSILHGPFSSEPTRSAFTRRPANNPKSSVSPWPCTSMF